MIVDRYWLYKLRYLHFSIISMILGYFRWIFWSFSYPLNNLSECLHHWFTFFSAALPVKNVPFLLFFPGLLVVLFKRDGLFRAIDAHSGKRSWSIFAEVIWISFQYRQYIRQPQRAGQLCNMRRDILAKDSDSSVSQHNTHEGSSSVTLIR
jgi:hypothetical protein